MFAELFAAGFVSTVLGGIQEKAELKRKMKDAGEKAQQWIAEREAVQKKHDERMAAILARYEKEDQEREARKQQSGVQEPEQEQRTASGTIHIDNISFSTSSNTADPALFDEIFKDFEKNFD